MQKPLPKPFGAPDANGFYVVDKSNRLALDTARDVLSFLPTVDFIGLGGYLLNDTPTDEDPDFRYHLIIGVPRLDCQPQEIVALAHASYARVSKARGVYWHHGPLNPVIMDKSDLERKIDAGDLGMVLANGFYHSLMFSAVPLWERNILMRWKNYDLTPFEHMQQLMFQYFDRPVQEDQELFFSSVTNDTAERFIL